MSHYGTLRDHPISEAAEEIRGAKLYGLNDEKLGKIDDVIFDRQRRWEQWTLGHFPRPPARAPQTSRRRLQDMHRRVGCQARFREHRHAAQSGLIQLQK